MILEYLGLSDEDILFKQSVRKLAEDANFLGCADRLDDEHICSIDEKIIDALKDIGMFGIIVPEEFGGSGRGMVTYCAGIEELGGFFSAANMIAVHAGLATFPFLMAGTKEQKERYLPKMARGEKIAAFGITEEAGADIGSTATRARREGDHYILNGSKKFITNGSIADVVVTLAYDESKGKRDGTALFIIESGYDGFSVGHIEEKMALNSVPVSELFYDEMKVPADNRLGDIGDGYHIVRETLDHCRVVLASGVLGVCKQAFKIVLGYVTTRNQGGKPLSENPAVRSQIGRMKSIIDSMQSSVYYTASSIDNAAKKGHKTHCIGTSSKVHCTEAAYEFFRIGSELMGGNSFTDGTFQRLYREATVIPRIYEGPNNVLHELMARDVIKSFKTW